MKLLLFQLLACATSFPCAQQQHDEMHSPGRTIISLCNVINVMQGNSHEIWSGLGWTALAILRCRHLVIRWAVTGEIQGHGPQGNFTFQAFSDCFWCNLMVVVGWPTANLAIVPASYSSCFTQCSKACSPCVWTSPFYMTAHCRKGISQNFGWGTQSPWDDGACWKN